MAISEVAEGDLIAREHLKQAIEGLSPWEAFVALMALEGRTAQEISIEVGARRVEVNKALLRAASAFRG